MKRSSVDGGCCAVLEWGGASVQGRYTFGDRPSLLLTGPWPVSRHSALG